MSRDFDLDTPLHRAIAEEARKYIGSPATRYTNRESGVSPVTGFDCSGFGTFIAKQVGLNLDFTSPPIRHNRDFLDRFGTFIPWSRQRLGDYAIFAAQGRFPRHLAIVSRIDDSGSVDIVHSPGKDGEVVIESKLKLQLRDELKGEVDPRKWTEEQRQRIIYPYHPIGFKRLGIIVGGHWLTDITLRQLDRINELIDNGEIDPTKSEAFDLLTLIGQEDLILRPFVSNLPGDSITDLLKNTP